MATTSMSQVAVFRSASPVDLMAELRVFINGAKGGTATVELTKTALFLLKNLPAAWAAVFEYFRGVFDAAAMNYIVRLETEISTGKLPPSEFNETVLNEVHLVLCSFVTSNAEVWAPIISTWSLELLGEVSTKYAGRAHVSLGLNETLQLWMNCRSTRTLIELTTQCLSCLMNANTEACISALLDTSVKHSPNFDWVVAHVGSCFPQTVIVRVLSCGLKDYCQNKSYLQGSDSPKLKSVVGILGHLATSHSEDIRSALLDLFKWCLIETTFQEGEAVRIQRTATVPFLLQLLSLSSILLNSVCDDIKQTLNLDVIKKLFEMSNEWLKYFGSLDNLQDLLVNLILKCERGRAQIIKLTLECVCLRDYGIEEETKKYLIRTSARELLECVLEEIDCSVRYHCRKKTLNLLNSLIYDVAEIYSILFSDRLQSQTGCRILTYIGQVNPPVLIEALSYVFQKSECDEHLSHVIVILGNELIDKTNYSEKGGHFSVVLEQVLERYKLNENAISDPDEYNRTWRNLLTLLRWERTGGAINLKSCCISKAIEWNLVELTAIYKSSTLGTPASHILCEILDLLEYSTQNSNGNVTCNAPLQVILNTIEGCINYFFTCCEETDEILRMTGFKRVRRVFHRLSIHSKIARNMALRQLLERALYAKDAKLFGAKEKNDENGEENKLLITQNKKISKTIHLTKHSSVYNGGIIGSGKRKSISSYHPPIDFISANTHQFVSVVKACCGVSLDGTTKTDTFLDSLTLVSLLLVQMVSPDVMYNGLPWPEEEFSKVTIERDLLISRVFNQTPVLWDLLQLVALHRPALCYCSVLIRALTACLMHQWTSMGDQSKSAETDSYKSLMKTTVGIIDVMALGQLLPPPLSSVRDVLPYLNSHEIVAILRECIWCYMRDHIPSPALFGTDANGLHWRDPTIVRPVDTYTKTLRVIMQRNITTVGHLYSQMFITIPKPE